MAPPSRALELIPCRAEPGAAEHLRGRPDGKPMKIYRRGDRRTSARAARTNSILAAINVQPPQRQTARREVFVYETSLAMPRSTGRELISPPGPQTPAGSGQRHIRGIVPGYEISRQEDGRLILRSVIMGNESKFESIAEVLGHTGKWARRSAIYSNSGGSRNGRWVDRMINEALSNDDAIVLANQAQGVGIPCGKDQLGSGRALMIRRKRGAWNDRDDRALHRGRL